MKSCNEVRMFWNNVAEQRRPRRVKGIYHKTLVQLCRFFVREKASVLEVGCGTGELLASTNPSLGMGVDISPIMVQRARNGNRQPHLKFVEGDAQALSVEKTFDYILMSDLVGIVADVQACFEQVHKVSNNDSRLIVTHYNKLWYPFIKFAEWLNLKEKSGEQNWLALEDLSGLLHHAGFEVITGGKKLLFPIKIPLVSSLFNKYLANLPALNRLCLIQYVVARRKQERKTVPQEKSVSIIIPTLNERDNIVRAIEETPKMGSEMEFIFVDGHSTDGTVEAIEQVVADNPDKDIKFAFQPGKGKADAVFHGFDMASNDLLMILDSDLTVPPEDLPKFYKALIRGNGEFINGCRLVYPMEKHAMRTLNYFANHFFGLAFTWLLQQRVKDTLCGTKVLSKKHYEYIKANRAFFGEFDPFGDFDLLFGAAKLGLKIADMPIRYRERTYGEIKISRFRHGMLLLRMCYFAAKKMKFN